MKRVEKLPGVYVGGFNVGSGKGDEVREGFGMRLKEIVEDGVVLVSPTPTLACDLALRANNRRTI
ncbi:MAG: hypothetical protein HYX63_09440 [Gammaproteobacteria bacterium]|nr:hypothetical protein [Gammaproteobacteria bacterium]